MASFIPRKSLKNPEPEPRRKNSRILGWVGKFFMGLGVMVFITVMFGVFSVVTMMGEGKKQDPLPQQFVLGIPLDGHMDDVSLQNPFLAKFMPPETSLIDFLRSVNYAKTDDRVQAIAVRLRDGDYGLTQIETIRNAIIDFRASGKKAYIYTDDFGSYSSGMGEYWIATAFDEIWIQPMGIVSLTGLRIEQAFFNEALDKIGVEMQTERRKEFKTAPDAYLRDSMSEEHIIAMRAIMGDMMDTMVGQMAKSRNLNINILKEAINTSPLLAEEALALNLVDKVGYIDEFDDRINLAHQAQIKVQETAQVDGEKPVISATQNAERVQFVPLDRYKIEQEKVFSEDLGEIKIATVFVKGAILDMPQNASSASPFAFLVPQEMADAQKIAGSIQMAAEDPNIKVIVLRIDSPGGSPNASETIRRAVVKAKKQGKYVIASMADTAASGGYWIAVDADTILAGNLTLTGSIGVFGGKPDLSAMWEKIGVNWQALEYGQNAAMWSSNTPYSDTERARLNAMMDHVYASFTSRVAQGRDMTAAEVERVAKGRVWTGLDAKTENLVDGLGGFEAAMALAADKAGIADWHSTRIMAMPLQDDPLSDIAKLIGFPIQSSMPKLPQMFVPALYPEAVVTTPPMQIDF